MKRKQRLSAIDLFRGIAVYAVVILHSDEGISILPGTWAIIVQFSGFAVPFFLTASFYLAINKLYISGSQYPLKSRLVRLIIPYGIWTLIYLVYKIAKYLINNEPERLKSLFDDPISLIFLGGAAFHLYFLPLLFSGTLLVKFSEHLIKKQIQLKQLILLGVLSFTLYELLLISGNSFQLASGVAFQPLLDSILSNGNKNPLVRLVLVELAWMLRCLPYISTAMILNHPFVRERFLKTMPIYTSVLFVMFLILNLWNGSFIPASVHEVARGYSAFLLAVFLSFNMKENSIINNLGLCSFGIYLIHLMVVEACQIIGNRVFYSSSTEVSTLTLLGISILSFLISWIATSFLINKKGISKLIFGN